MTWRDASSGTPGTVPDRPVTLPAVSDGVADDEVAGLAPGPDPRPDPRQQGRAPVDAGTRDERPGAGALTLVVPLYNEQDRFPRFCRRLAAFVAEQPAGSELVFVDDGSDDGTAELVESVLAEGIGCRARLLRRPHLGKGAAVQAGLETATTPIAAFCDVDLSTPPADMARVIDAARDAAMLAIASRDLVGSHITRPESAVREFLGRAFNRAVQFTVAPGILDTQCGAKAARTDVWREVLPLCRETGFAWDVEVVALARRRGVAVQEIAVEWHHDDGTRVNVLRDGARMVASLPRIRRNVTSASGAVPAPADPSGTFDDERARVLAAVDDVHWWVRSKAALVASSLRRWAAPRGPLVDLGGGAGGVASMLGWPRESTVVVEGNALSARIARERHAFPVVQSDVTRSPLMTRSAAVACLLDVLEHLPEPDVDVALAEAHRVLVPGGRLVVTVPGHPWLWSASDRALGHERRYTTARLRRDVEHAGFDVVVISHVFSWLVLPVWLRRRRRAGEPQLGLEIRSALVDRVALVLTRAERALLGRVPLPVGTSLLCVATRRGPSAG